MRVRTWSKLLSAPAILLVGGLVLQACAKQGEAERCEVPSDCESGLSCVERNGFKYCCPAQGQETTAECKQSGGTVPTTDTGTADTEPTDTGTTEDAETDATVDASDAADASETTDGAEAADAADAPDAD